jgi:hypothetical protein
MARTKLFLLGSCLLDPEDRGVFPPKRHALFELHGVRTRFTSFKSFLFHINAIKKVRRQGHDATNGIGTLDCSPGGPEREANSLHHLIPLSVGVCVPHVQSCSGSIYLTTPWRRVATAILHRGSYPLLIVVATNPFCWYKPRTLHPEEELCLQIIPLLMDAMFEAGVEPHTTPLINTADLLQRDSPSVAEQQRKWLLCRVSFRRSCTCSGGQFVLVSVPLPSAYHQDDWWVEKNLDRIGRGLTWELFWNLRGGTEENCESL